MKEDPAARGKPFQHLAPINNLVITVFFTHGYLETLPQTSGMYMGNASIIPRNYRKYLYHAYLAYMEANGYRNVLSLKMFGLGLPVMLKEYGLNYEKRHTKQGIQTNLTLKEESYGDWLPKCDDPATT